MTTPAARLAPLAVSLGDPAGIGPEIIAACWQTREEHRLPPFFVAGGAAVLAAAAKAAGLTLAITIITEPAEAIAVFPHALPVLGMSDGDYTPGAPDDAGARLALASLTAASQATVAGEAAALVTAPVAKAQLAGVGFGYPGQTEFVAAACGVAPESAVMMLAVPGLRTVPLTVHVPLSAVPGLITPALIIAKARIVAAALARDFGIAAPRLAIAALNPHAGERGRMGDEDARVIAPAIATLVAEGIAASGPHPADALFTPRARASYDVALCMYHDQALIPVKSLDFDHGVNITLGLPVIRTSPDHGTAFDIAGRGTAEPRAMRAALIMAADCAHRRAGRVSGAA